ncbi:MAG TPA: nucleotidyltransferase family protein [Terracidiphilus sp.]|jgi:molybdenum cofactor cytidylyltransferase
MIGGSKLCGLILAAGESSRMGSDKAMLPWPPTQPGTVPPGPTLLSAAILAFEPFTRLIVVVAGNNAQAVGITAGACGAFTAHNAHPELGQFSSLQVGLREVLSRGCDSAMITPVDCPPLSAVSLERLCDSFQRAEAQGMWAVAPENDGRHGHPLLVGREIIMKFLDAPVTTNAREILHAHAHRVAYVSVPDSLEKAGLNTPEDYEALSAKTIPRLR